jgi:hypothetical protein
MILKENKSLFCIKGQKNAPFLVLCKNTKAFEVGGQQYSFRNIGVKAIKFVIIFNKLIMNNFMIKFRVDREVKMLRLMRVVVQKYNSSSIKFILKNLFNYSLLYEFIYIKQPAICCRPTLLKANSNIKYKISCGEGSYLLRHNTFL